MPIYEYRCEKCGAELERLQKMNEPAPTCTSEDCANEARLMSRKVSRTNFELKGGGWYKDGYS